MKRTIQKPRRTQAIFACAVALVLGGFAFGAGSAKGADPVDAGVPRAVPGEVLVVFDDAEAAELSVDAAEGEAQIMSRGAEIPVDAPADEAAPAVVEGYEIEEAEVIAPDLAGQTVVSLELANENDTAALIDALDGIEGVTAQPNYVYALVDSVSSVPLPNDKHFDLQYYLGPLGDGTNDSGANLIAAWEKYAEVDDPASVTVGVLDTGIDPTHPDLQENVRYDLAYNVVEDRPVMYDNKGHGTHVAGTIAATSNNEICVAGSATGAFASPDGSRVSVVPVNIFPEDPDEGTDVSNIVKGIDYLIDLIDDGTLTDLRVVNLSVGVYTDGDVYHFDPAFKSAIDEITARGVLCVGAGGNGDGDATPYTTPMFPSDYPPVLSVTSLTKEGANSAFSDYNAYKDISAPGEDIAATMTGGVYAYLSGTSMASPIVSSVAALMASANPALTPAEIHDLVRETAAPLPSSKNSHGSETGSAGAIDAAAAVAAAISGQESVGVYRLYNEWTGEHLLTADADEYMGLQQNHYGGWVGESSKFSALSKDAADGQPIYRLYNPYNGDHFYTESDEERANLEGVGWKFESIAWRGTDADEGIEVFRLYNPYMTSHGGLGNHLWTTSEAERDDLTARGWQQESCPWKALG